MYFRKKILLYFNQFCSGVGWVLGNVVPKKSPGTIGLCRQGDTTDYIPKFQVAKMSLEVAEIRFSNLVLQANKIT